jgi:hypothetical protein
VRSLEEFQVAFNFPVRNVGVVLVPFLAAKVDVVWCISGPITARLRGSASKASIASCSGGAACRSPSPGGQPGSSCTCFRCGGTGSSPSAMPSSPAARIMAAPRYGLVAISAARHSTRPPAGECAACWCGCCCRSRCRPGPGKARHAALAQQPFVAVDRGAGDGADGLGVAQHPGYDW